MANTTFTFTSKELNARERIQLKDRSNAINIGSLVDGAENLPVIDIDYFAVLHIEPDGEDKEPFDSYIFIDKNGAKYTTSSPSFWNAFFNIHQELIADGIEEMTIECYKAPCQNRQGSYLACRLV